LKTPFSPSLPLVCSTGARLVDDLKFTDSTFSNIDSILYNADEQIWHWNDPKIGTHQKKWWNDNKDRTFAAVFDLQTKRFFKLGNDSLTNIPYTANSKFALAYNQEKYSKKSTYDGFYYDLYLINLDNGDKTLIAEKISEPASISPKGAYSLFFKDKHWYSVNNETKIISNITQNIPIPFYDVDNDVPMEPSSYGVGGWFEDEKFVFINEKYDIYKFLPSQPGSFINATATVGRKNKIIFRIANIDKDKKYFNERDTIFMHGYSEDLRAKNIFFFETHIAGGIDLNVTDNEFFAEKKNYTIVRRSKFTNKLLYKKDCFFKFRLISEVFVQRS